MENNLVSLEKYKEDNALHSSGECKCLACDYKWVGVVPIGTIWLECPKCHLMRGRFIYHCQREDSYWTCKCGNELFYITHEGCYCPNCGLWQKGF